MQKELQKEEKVAHVHDQNTKIVFDRRPAPVVASRIEGRHTDDTSHDHLRNLCHGNPLGVEPFGLAFDGHQKVVKIHDGVHTVIDGGVNESGRTVCDKGVPSGQENRDVMVPVQQNELSLVRDDKKCINEFTVIVCVCSAVQYSTW